MAIFHQNKKITTSNFLSDLPNANAKSQRFSYAISQIATLPPVVALNRSSKSQIATRHTAFWHAAPQIALAAFLCAPKSQRFKSQRLQDANATKSQTLAFCKSQRFSATKITFKSILLQDLRLTPLPGLENDTTLRALFGSREGTQEEKHRKSLKIPWMAGCP